jgi:hypothetical protein
MSVVVDDSMRMRPSEFITFTAATPDAQPVCDVIRVIVLFFGLIFVREHF